MKNKLENMSSTQLLNLYINSAGKKASYYDVVKAVKKEKIAKKVTEIKSSYKYAYPFILILYFINLFLEEISAD